MAPALAEKGRGKSGTFLPDEGAYVFYAKNVVGGEEGRLLPKSVFIFAILALVNTGPGETHTARIPYLEPYCAIDLVSPCISPAFAVGYSIPLPAPSAPVIEPILIIKPLFCLRICDNTACAK